MNAAETMNAKVTALTASNVSALRQAAEEVGLDLKEVTKTTAVFVGGPTAATKNLTAAIDALGARYGRRGHPVQSLQAVRRKLQAKIRP